MGRALRIGTGLALLLGAAVIIAGLFVAVIAPVWPLWLDLIVGGVATILACFFIIGITVLIEVAE